MPKDTIFDRFNQHLIKGLDKPRADALYEYGEKYKTSLGQLAMPGQVWSDDSGPDQKSRKRIADARDEGFKIFNTLVSGGLEEEALIPGAFTPRTRAVISKAARPVAAQINKIMRTRAGLAEESHVDMAIGLVGAHYTIWSPDLAEKNKAKDIYTTALKGIMKILPILNAEATVLWQRHREEWEGI